jgi:7-carboxy-7-deazaguanine synthase
MTDTSRADLLISEVFSAIQGEAALVGFRQVFVRLAGCNIRCSYCDQPEALHLRPGPCRIEQTAGRRDWSVGDSPLAIDDVIASVERLWHDVPHHSISLTGGEPLVQAQRLVSVLPLLTSTDRAVMLETNGMLVGSLRRVLAWITYVSMDVKLHSVDGADVDPDTQREFLDTSLRAGVTTWVKVVIGPTTDPDELLEAVAMVGDTADRTGTEPEIYLQPVTPFAAVDRAPTPEHILDLHDRCLRRYPNVRVVPQTHKAIGQL